jgi:hypothetical protein
VQEGSAKTLLIQSEACLESVKASRLAFKAIIYRLQSESSEV